MSKLEYAIEILRRALCADTVCCCHPCPDIRAAIRLLEAAGKVDMVSEAIEELGKNNLRYCHVIALLSALPDAKEADHD